MNFNKLLQFISKLAINSINVYQYIIAPYIPTCCIFKISCSTYTKAAILKYGFYIGVLKGIFRLLNCHLFTNESSKANLEDI